jgi:hypothetical protein
MDYFLAGVRDGDGGVLPLPVERPLEVAAVGCVARMGEGVALGVLLALDAAFIAGAFLF